MPLIVWLFSYLSVWANGVEKYDDTIIFLETIRLFVLIQLSSFETAVTY